MLPTVGKETRGGDPAASPSGHAYHFGAAWHTDHGTQTAGKIAWLAQRDTPKATNPLCGDQKTQAGPKNTAQAGLMAHPSLSYVVPSDDSESAGRSLIVYLSLAQSVMP